MRPSDVITKELIKFLRTRFPFRPKLTTEHREIDFMMGQQSVIETLERELEAAEEIELSAM